MIQCRTCETHRMPHTEVCPWCGSTSVTLPLASAAALLLGLTLTGCPAPQPKYGISTPTDTVEQTADTAETTSE